MGDGSVLGIADQPDLRAVLLYCTADGFEKGRVRWGAEDIFFFFF